MNTKSPYEVLYDEPVDYSCLRMFSCLAFASTLTDYRTKFQPHATICVFLRYPPEVKGYKLYDIKSKKIVILRDVIFHEDNFPFHKVVEVD